MGIKNDVQLKLAVFAQKGGWNHKLVQTITAPLFWVLLISGFARSVYYSVLLTTRAVDTATYVNYHANILKGETDGLRTPIYPYFIKLVGLFGQQDLLAHVVTAQIVFSFLSIIIFYKIVRACFKNSRVIFIASLCYGLLLPVVNFDKLVLTESLSVDMVLVFIYLVIRYLQKPGGLKAALLTLFVFVGIMLRPSFIYLVPLVIVFWVLRFVILKRERKACLCGMAAVAVVLLLIAGYSRLNKKNAGFNAISVVSNNNELAVIVNAGMYMNGNDAEISAAIKSNLQTRSKPDSGTNIMLNYEPERVHQFIFNCIKNQPLVYALTMYNKLIALQHENIFTNYAEHKLSFLAFRVENVEYMVFCVTFNILYLFIIADLVLILAGWIKRKQAPWFRIVLWLIIAGQFGVTITGGYSEYQRLILAIIPVLIIALFGYIDKICFAVDRGKLKSYTSL